jgi:UDP-N-acetylmuramoyl-L-alanyl-D-glutamate--2,6-diaminopimelate ligase
VHVQKLLNELLRPWLDGQPCPSVPITQLSYDSRADQLGALFFAYQTDLCDRGAFIAEAVANGAAAVVIDQDRSDEAALITRYPHITIIPVKNLSHLYGSIAARFYDNPADELLIMGVTGTNGKSSTAYFIAQALTILAKPCGFIGTFGVGMLGHLSPSSKTTLHPTAFNEEVVTMKAAGAKAIALEMSSHALQQERMQGVPINTAILTHITSDHLDYHKTHEAYVAAKERCMQLPGLQYAVLNCDDAAGYAWAKRYQSSLEIIGFAEQANVFEDLPFIHKRIVLNKVVHHQQGMTVAMTIMDQLFTIETVLVGHFNALNMAATAGALLAQDYAVTEIAKALSQLKGTPGRMEYFGGERKPTVYVDYAHTTDGLEKALKAARSHTEGKLTVVFGCGGDRDTSKRAEMGAVAAQLADKIVITSDNVRSEDPQLICEAVLAGVKQQPSFDLQQSVIILNRPEAIQQALQQASPADCILVAGKGHETTQVFADRVEECDDRAIVQTCLEENAWS